MTAQAAAGWVDAQTVRLRGADVTLSEPVLVGRSKGYFWFPTMARLSSGDLVAGMSTEPDESTDKPTARRLWSADGGLSWGYPQDSPFGSDSSITLDSGDQLFLPYNLGPLPGGGMKGPYAICRRGEHSLQVFPEGLTVTGWPAPDRSGAPEKGLSGFVFDGQTLRLKDGKHLAGCRGLGRLRHNPRPHPAPRGNVGCREDASTHGTRRGHLALVFLLLLLWHGRSWSAAARRQPARMGRFGLRSTPDPKRRQGRRTPKGRVPCGAERLGPENLEQTNSEPARRGRVTRSEGGAGGANTVRSGESDAAWLGLRPQMAARVYSFSTGTINSSSGREYVAWVATDV